MVLCVCVELADKQGDHDMLCVAVVCVDIGMLLSILAEIQATFTVCVCVIP